MAQRSGKLARAAGLASLLLLLTGPAAAEGVYLGVGFGQGRADFDTLGDTIEDDRESTAHKLFTGYRLARYFAVEAFFANLRSYSATVQTGAGTITGEAEIDGFGAAVILGLPLGEKSELYAKGGVFRWDVVSSSNRANDADPMFGVGLHLRGPGPNASTRIEYERFKDVGGGVFPGTSDGIDVDLLTLGIIYNF